MIQKLFAIYDKTAEIYSPLYQANSTGEASRIFADLVINPQSQINRHPDDYDLVYLGYWDNETGLINADQEQTITTGTDVVRLINERSAARNPATPAEIAEIITNKNATRNPT